MNPLVWQYLGYFCAPLVTVLGILLFVKRRETRRARAMDLAQTFGEWQLQDLANLCKQYAIGDYAGLAQTLHQLINRLETEGAPAVFRGVGWKVVENVFCKSPDDLKRLKDTIAATEALAAKAVTVAAPAIAAAIPSAAPLVAVAAPLAAAVAAHP